MNIFSILILKFNYFKITVADFFINVALVFTNTVYLESKSFWWVDDLDLRHDQHYVSLTFSFRRADRVIVKRNTIKSAILACQQIHKKWTQKYWEGVEGYLYETSKDTNTYTLYLDPIKSTTTWGIRLG